MSGNLGREGFGALADGLVYLAGRKFLIATTGIVNGNSIVDSVAGVGKVSGPKDAGL